MESLVNKETITSIEIAEITGKRHADVMRSIRNMEEAWINLNQRNFALVSYIDNKSEARPMYQLSKTECLYIATKFNDTARAKLILRWEELENNAKKPMSTLDMVQASINAIRKNEQELVSVKQDILELKAKSTSTSNYYTIVGYATLKGISCGLKLASSLGRKASALCKNRDIKTEQLPDPRFGIVKTYPKHVLEEVFSLAL